MQEINCHISVVTELFHDPSLVGERKIRACRGFGLGLCEFVFITCPWGEMFGQAMGTHNSSCSENSTWDLIGALLGAAPSQEPLAWRLYPYNCITSNLKTLLGHDGRGQGEPHLLSPTPNPNLQASQSLRRWLTDSASDINIYVPVSALLFFLYSKNFNILVLLPHEKKSCLSFDVPFVFLWMNGKYRSNSPPLDFVFGPLWVM